MAETILEKATCESCGARVRENTLYCYNCGTQVPNEQVDGDVDASETNGANSDLAAIDPIPVPDEELSGTPSDDPVPDSKKLADAAAERKKARISRRKPRQVVWDPADESADRWFVLVTLLITAIAAGVVTLALYLK